MKTLNYIGGAFNYVISNNGGTSFCLRLIKGKKNSLKMHFKLDQNSFVLW